MKQFLLAALLILTSTAQAQWVPVSLGFGSFFQSKYPSCITYDTPSSTYSLDTTCVDIVLEDTLNLTYFGIGNDSLKMFKKNELLYFKNLTYFNVGGNWGVFPDTTYIPPAVRKINISEIDYTQPFICTYPPNLDSLRLFLCDSRFIGGRLPDNLRYLELSGMYNVDSIKNIPLNLEELYISKNLFLNAPITATSYNIPSMMASTKLKKVTFFEIRELPSQKNMDESFLHLLPPSVEDLSIIYGGDPYSSIDSIHYLPPNLKRLVLHDIDQIDYFPDSLEYLDITGKYTCLPEYPQTLTYLNVNADSNFCHPNSVPVLGIDGDLCSIPGNNFYGCTLAPAYVEISDRLGMQLITMYPTCCTYDSGLDIYYLDTNCVEVLQEDSLAITMGYTAGFTIGADEMPYFKNLVDLQLIESGGGYMLPEFNFPPNLKSLSLNGIGKASGINYPKNLETFVIGLNNWNLNYDTLPETLKTIKINNPLGLDSLLKFPDSLQSFYLINGQHTQKKPQFPSFKNLTKLRSVYFDAIRYVPDSMFAITIADENLIKQLPDWVEEIDIRFPDNYVIGGYTYKNSFDTIRYLPPGLKKLTLQHVDQIDYFPNGLVHLDITGAYTCLPEYPQTLQSLAVNSDPNFCHPNNVPVLGIDGDLCSIPGNNFYSCPELMNKISGTVFHDENGNCSFEITEDQHLSGIPIVIQGVTSSFFVKAYTDEDGYYTVSVPDGDYTISVDTSETSLRNSCTEFEYAYDTIFDAFSYYAEFNFQLTCDTLLYNVADSFDLYIDHIYSENVRPGNDSTRFCIGTHDILYNAQLNCTSGLQNSLDSLVKYEVKIYGAPDLYLANNASGIEQVKLQDTIYISYIDSNYLSKDYAFFCFYISIDTLAQAGEYICLESSILPPKSDVNAANNYLTHCVEVVNSYDPNYKETYPWQMKPGFDDEIRYTIHFQNLGTAPALNVKILDTLDAQLNLSSFKLIEASHNVLPYLNGNQLLFKFNDINLADSLSDPEGSKGYVTYSIKPKAPMVLNDEIHNTAHIYFDFNPSIVTNTSVNLCTDVLVETPELSIEKDLIVVYPNPVRNENSIRLRNLPAEETKVRLIQINGAVIGTYDLSAEQNAIDVSKLQPGIYLLNFELNGKLLSKKVVKL